MVSAPRSTEPLPLTYMRGCLIPVHIVGNAMPWLDTKIHCVGIYYANGGCIQ